MEFLGHEVKKGRLTERLQPLQAGIGTIANAVMHGFIESPFYDLTMYSEVLQDSTFDLFDAGKLNFASGSSITLSKPKYEQVMADITRYKPRLILRPQEISNHPEIIRRLGIIAINTALEFDIYGNVNSTHVGGTQMMNGIGGSGDFARNGYLSVFVTKSIAKDGALSSVVPMVSHVDHTEHDVDIVVTEVGPRGLARTRPARTRPRHHRQLRPPALPRRAGRLFPACPRPRRPHAPPHRGGLLLARAGAGNGAHAGSAPPRSVSLRRVTPAPDPSA